jgi:hypothetical protein
MRVKLVATMAVATAVGMARVLGVRIKINQTSCGVPCAGPFGEVVRRTVRHVISGRGSKERKGKMG